MTAIASDYRKDEEGMGYIEFVGRLEVGIPLSKFPAILYQPGRPQPTSFTIAFLQQDKGNERYGLRVYAGIEFAR